MKKNIFDKIVDACTAFVVKRYILVLVIMAAITVPMIYYFFSQQHNNQIDVYFEKDDPDLLLYKRFQKYYGNDELIVIAFKKENIFTLENIALIRNITDTLKNDIKEVQRVFSITEAIESISRNDTLKYQKIIPEKITDEKELLAAKSRLVKNPVYVNSVISPDGKTSSIGVELRPLRDAEKIAALNRIKEISRRIAGDKLELHFGGLPIAEVEMNRLSKRDFDVFTPVAGAVVFIVIWLSLRNLALTIICQLNMIIIILWGVGYYVYSGEMFNVMTIILAPILLTVAVEDSIHVLTEYRDDYNSSHGMDLFPEHIKKTIGLVWVPCFFTTVTNALGFLSFGPATIRPVQVLGVYTGIAVFAAFFITIFFIPAALMLFRNVIGKTMAHKDYSKHEESGPLLNMLMAIVKFDIRNKKLVSIVLITLLAASAYIGIKKLHFQTNTINYLPMDNPIRADVDFIEENLGGVIPVVILIRAKSPEHDFTHAGGLELIDRIQRDFMAKVKQYTVSFSIAQYMKEMNRAFNNNDDRFYSIPADQDTIKDFYELSEEDIVRRAVTPDFMEARITFQSRWETNETAAEMGKYMIIYLRTQIPKEYSHEVTGLSSLYVQMERNLFTSQIYSFILAFVSIFIMMYFVCRNIPLTVISMVPNVFPVFITLGVMGIFNIPFDIVTIMIGGITIGIVVDDTTHFMIWFRRNMMKGMTHEEAVVQTFRDVGRPTFFNSFILLCGFFVLVLGSIWPTRMFGYLSAFTLLVAPFGDYFILPALIVLFKPKVKK